MTPSARRESRDAACSSIRASPARTAGEATDVPAGSVTTGTIGVFAAALAYRAQDLVVGLEALASGHAELRAERPRGRAGVAIPTTVTTIQIVVTKRLWAKTQRVIVVIICR